jgi:hypothetical protein
VRFSLAGSGCLIDNQGTSTGSRVVELYNGRARISIRCNEGACTAGVTSEGHCAGVCERFQRERVAAGLKEGLRIQVRRISVFLPASLHRSPALSAKFSS